MYLFLRVFDPEWSGKKEQIRFTYLNIRRFVEFRFTGTMKMENYGNYISTLTDPKHLEN